jgi:hypothetical protein
MIEKLFDGIQNHLSMLDLAITSSEKIKIYAANEDLERVVSETENRERLINVVTKLQRAIEEQINILNPEDVNQDDILLLKAWFQDLNLCSERMIAIDKETVELLSQQKSSTTKEIALIFKNKEMFKGYNQGTSK